MSIILWFLSQKSEGILLLSQTLDSSTMLNILNTCHINGNTYFLMSNAQIINSYIETEYSRQGSEITLIAHINERINELMLLVTNAERPSEKLVEFVKAYISNAPKYLNAFGELAIMTRIENYTAPFLKKAVELFCEEHPIVDKTEGVEKLLYKAYFCHRMLEEINDRVALERQVPLAPVDMAHTNLVAHTIIGDEDANALDQSILIQLELINATIGSDLNKLFEKSSSAAIATAMAQKGWKDAYKNWPFLKHDITDILLD